MRIHQHLIAASLAAGALVVACSAWAAATAQEAAKLQNELTPLGGERAGNKEGTIPPWTGGYTKVPPGYQSGQPRPDPFAADKPLFSITSKNMSEYADKLSEGQQALLKKYPTYRIDVYPTHRSMAAPAWVYDNTFKNATRAKLTENGSVEGAYGGIPFPIPKTGDEAMWNHLIRWRGEAVKFPFRSYVIPADGKTVLAAEALNEWTWPYYYKDGSLETFKGEHNLLYQVTTSPSFKAGETILLRDSLDQTVGSSGRQAWQYLVGQRRVRRAPTLAYDTPNPVNSGADFFDEPFVFLGALDRYQWKLVGKKELIVPYNMNRFFLKKDAEVLGPNHFNPEHMRWELHRVWVVEATLAPGKRHVMPKRRFYLDEDSWIAVLGDGWDAQGQLWHTNVALPWVVYELPGVLMEEFGTYDLLKGAYSATIFNDMKVQFQQVPRYPDSNFTPESMSARGVR